MDPRAFLLRATVGVLTLAPSWAAACPACAARGGTSGAVGWAIGAMIASPLLVGGVLAAVARRLEVTSSDDDAREP